MRIAVIAPVIRKISTNNAYGGIERIITSLVIGSADAGHEVTLYAPFGTDLSHKNLNIVFSTDQNVAGIPELIKRSEDELFQRIVSDQEQFDIIHTHIEPIIARIDDNNNYFDKILKPVVITVHNQTHIENNINYYKTYKPLHNLNFVFISHDQSKPLEFLPNHTIIYNGICLDELTFNATPNTNQLAFLGRITPEKGILQAIHIAMQSGKKLLIAAAIDYQQQEFYENEIKPLIDGDKIIYLGEVNNEGKDNLLRNSEALLFPIQWHEPFGLVMIEAMATGTPVIASNIGSVSEIIEDGRTGFVISDINNIDNYVQSMNGLKDIDRTYCRKIAEEKFSDKIMISNYLQFYESKLSN